MRLFMILWIVSFTLSGCSSIPGKMNQLYIGMPKVEALKLLGQPDFTSSVESGEVAHYNGVIVSFGVTENFFVYFESERVKRWGQPQRAPLSPAQAAMLMNMQQQNFQNQQLQQQQLYQQQQQIYRPAAAPVNCTSNNMGGTTFTNCR